MEWQQTEQVVFWSAMLQRHTELQQDCIGISYMKIPQNYFPEDTPL